MQVRRLNRGFFLQLKVFSSSRDDSHCTSRYFWAWKSFTAGWSMMQMTATPSSSLETVSLSRLVTVNILSYNSSTVASPGNGRKSDMSAITSELPPSRPAHNNTVSPGGGRRVMRIDTITSKQISHSYIYSCLIQRA